jgi:hypothetical protein
VDILDGAVCKPCVPRTEKCQFRAEKCRFRAEKCQFRAEKCPFRAEKCLVRAEKCPFPRERERERGGHRAPGVLYLQLHSTSNVQYIHCVCMAILYICVYLQLHGLCVGYGFRHEVCYLHPHALADRRRPCQPPPDQPLKLRAEKSQFRAEKCQFRAEKCQFRAEKSQFRAEKSQFRAEKCPQMAVTVCNVQLYARECMLFECSSVRVGVPAVRPGAKINI